MKEDISRDDRHGFLPRWLEPRLRAAAAAHPVLVLTGARQVGKSTLLRHARPFRAWRYVTLDDFEMLAQAERDPEALWAGADRVIVDEVQREPRLLLGIKRAVDQDRRRRFVLSGSSNLLLMHRVSESLAGRAVYFSLSPLTLGEERMMPAPTILERLLRGDWPAEAMAGPPPDHWSLMVRGFLPPVLFLSTRRAILEWWEGYVATYLERDLRQLSHVASLTDFRRVMQALARRAGQPLNQTAVSQECALPLPTVHRYLNLLETTSLVQRVPAFARNRGKRLSKAPKLVWTDPGLAAFLAGFHEAAALEKSREAGGFLETLVYHHVHALAQLMTPRPTLMHWRTVSGAEVDFVVEHGRRVLALEVKATGTPRHSDAEGLRRFMEDHPEAVGGVLLHTGREVRRLGQKIVAMPWWLLAGG